MEMFRPLLTLTRRGPSAADHAAGILADPAAPGVVKLIERIRAQISRALTGAPCDDRPIRPILGTGAALMWNGQTVSVAFSTYRDLLTIRGVIDGFFATGVVDEVIAVDNNAEEGTKDEIASTNARYAFEPRQGLGFGFQRALHEATGDIIVSVEVDGTYVPSDILKLLAYSSDFDVVCGTRTASLMFREGSDMGFLTRWSNVICAKVVEVLFNTGSLTDVGCIYRLIKRSTWEQIRDLPMDGGWAFNLDWMLHIARRRIRFIEVPVSFLPRTGEAVGAGKSRLKAAQIALRMMGFILRHRFNLIPNRRLREEPSGGEDAEAPRHRSERSPRAAPD